MSITAARDFVSFDEWTQALMLASYSNVGPGILFVLTGLIVSVGCLFWIAFWMRKGFRSRGWHDSRRVRIGARISLAAIMLLMIGFPPLRRVGDWTESRTQTSIPLDLANSYDRSFFGYIPTYAWIGRCATKEIPETSSTVSLEPGESYHLDEIQWRVDWSLIVVQFGVALLFAFPFMVAQNGPGIGKQ